VLTFACSSEYFVKLVSIQYFSIMSYVGLSFASILISQSLFVRLASSFSSASQSSVTRTIGQQSLQETKKLVDYFGKGVHSNAPTILEDEVSVSKYINDNFDNVLFDCDGVLYRGEDPIPQVAQAIESLVQANKSIYFVTNNAGYSRLQLRDKLAGVLGTDYIQEKHIISSSFSACKYMEQFAGREAERPRYNVFVVGSPGLSDELSKHGYNVMTSSDERAHHGMDRDALGSFNFNEYNNVDAVVVGLDTDFNYRKLCTATNIIHKNEKCAFIATNKDAFDLVGVDARRLPGNGSIVSCIETATQRKATNVGKPSSALISLFNDYLGLDATRSILVGDRLDTDISFANKGGLCSALVMTGCTTSDCLIKVMGEESYLGEIPKIVFPHVGMIQL
jgi:phosphoglycolate/pyridoxal phosphate phosphatase family enzyme